jgi:hypothetical protein
MEFDYMLVVYIVAPLLVVAAALYGVYWFFFKFIQPRAKSNSLRGVLRYVREIPVAPEEEFDNRRTINKRDKRRVKLRKSFMDLRERQMKEIEELKTKLEGAYVDEDEEAGDDKIGGSEFEDNWVNKLIETNLVLRNLRSSFIAMANALNLGSVKGRTNESKRQRKKKGFFEEVNESTKSKRFISQDRLQRAEARKLLRKRIEVLENEVKEIEDKIKENVISLLDIEENQEDATRQALANRKEKLDKNREAMKEELKENYIDRVAINSGPPKEVLPAGCHMVNFIPNVERKLLVYRRVMYLWEGEKSPAQGWFIGTIVSASKATGSNFNIKYDRSETKSLFVDGVKAVSLQMEGINAYGRRWVILEADGFGEVTRR